MGSGRPSLSLLSSEWVGSKTLLKQDHRRSEIYPGGGISQLTESGQGCRPLSLFPVPYLSFRILESPTRVLPEGSFGERFYNYGPEHACRSEYGQKKHIVSQVLL